MSDLEKQVRAVLRVELESRGYQLASDTAGLYRHLYVRGDGDTARALFEFYSSAREAFESMYQGSWLIGLPPRFAVLPRSEVGTSSLDLLEQARIHVLFYSEDGHGPTFPDLGSALALLG